jgi:serine/threonine-protein kinase
MAEPARTESALARQDEERLAHALVSRDLVTREEVQRCRSGDGAAPGPEALLRRLVKAGLLTAGQADRARQELSALLAQKVPGFELLEKVGQGSMGTVYKARQVSMNRLVAVKVLHPRVAADPTLLADLTREAHLAARLGHNNIVQAIDVGQAGTLHYFVMEYIEGRTVRQELDDGKTYDETEAVGICLQVARALEHAHKRGLVHRDVKPGNVVVTSDGTVKLADLGMARDTGDARHADRERGLVIGTPYYMAPEQIRGRADIDGRADLYSLGATFYHMVTGRPPFPGTNVDSILQRHLEEEPTPADHVNRALSSGLGEVLETLLTKDRRRRYQSAGDLILDLECLQRGEPPRLVRRGVAVSALGALARGEEDEDRRRNRKEEDDEVDDVEVEDEEDEEHEGGRTSPELVQRLWSIVLILGGLLFVSVLVNLILLVRRS